MDHDRGAASVKLSPRWVAVAALGLSTVVMVGGTFAPWLQSGRVTRSSYGTAGLLERLLGIDGAAGAALTAMPGLALAAAAGIVIYILGWHQLSATVLTVLAVVMGAVSVVVLLAPTSPQVSIVATGPAITLAGAVLTIAAAAALVVTHRADN